MMNKPNARAADKRVTVAVGLMASVLAMIGSQNMSSSITGSGGLQPSAAAFASASAPSR